MKKLQPLCFFLFIFICLFGLAAAAQTIPVKGTIKDQKDQPIDGATITIRGSGRAVTSAADGTFTINAAAGDFLVTVLPVLLRRNRPYQLRR